MRVTQGTPHTGAKAPQSEKESGKTSGGRGTAFHAGLGHVLSALWAMGSPRGQGGTFRPPHHHTDRGLEEGWLGACDHSGPSRHPGETPEVSARNTGVGWRSARKLGSAACRPSGLVFFLSTRAPTLVAPTGVGSQWWGFLSRVGVPWNSRTRGQGLGCDTQATDATRDTRKDVGARTQGPSNAQGQAGRKFRGQKVSVGGRQGPGSDLPFSF